MTRRSFDAVVAIGLLMHIPGAGLPDAVLQISRLLRPGGVFFFDVSVGRTGLQDGHDGTGRLWDRYPRGHVVAGIRKSGYRHRA